MSIFDPFGPYVFAVFAAGLLAVASTTWPVRWWLARLRGAETRADAEGLDPYEGAFLLGCEPRAVYVALASLQAQGAVAVRERQRTLVATGAAPADAHPLELAVLRALDTLDEEQRYGDAITGAVIAHVREPLAELDDRMERRGLMVSTRTADREQRRGTWSLLGFAFVTLVVALIGGSREQVPWAMFGVVLAAMACAFALGVRRPVRTPAGVRAAKALIDGGAGGPVPRRPAVIGQAAEGGGEEGGLAALRRVLAAPPLPGTADGGSDPAWSPALAEGAPAPAGDGGFGYVVAGWAHACTQGELMAMCAEGRMPRLVWTPASPALVHPAEVPWLFERLRAARAAKRAAPLRGSATQAGLFLFLWGTSGFVIPSFWMVMLAAEAFALVPAWREWRRAKALTPAELRRPAAAVEVSEWALRVRAKKALYTPWICRALIPVGLVQLVTGMAHSMDAAGLVKEAVRHGQWWRLLTAPTLHGNVFHLLGNYVSLAMLGGLVERHGRRWHMPAVLVVSAIGGSAASQLLSSASSVGISGGIMGCLGYLLVVGWRYRNTVAPGFFRSMLYSAAIVGFVGLLGYGVIDNAAHAGGLAAGILAGLALVPRHGLDEMDEPERTTPGGWAWASVFFGFCALAMVMMFVR
jgi:uncharacterized protein (TIGR04222 family)